MSVVQERQNVTDKAAIIYNACLAVPDLEDRPDVIFAIMNASGLAQWPTTGQRKDKNSIDRTTIADVLKQSGITTLFSLSVSRDSRKLNSYAIQLDQPEFSTVGRNELINQTTDYSKPIIDAYKNVIIVAMKIMKPNLMDDKLNALADKLLAFERKLANLTAPLEDRRDMLGIYHRTTIDELERNFSKIPIRDLLQKKFCLANIILAQNETVELFAFEYYRKLNTFLGTAEADTLFNYAGLRRMLKWASTVSHDFREASLKLRVVKQGVHVEKPRWQRCVDEVNDGMPEVVGKLYVQSKFSPEAKYEVQDLARRLMIVFNESLQTFKWMDETTRDAAEKKLAQMATKIGYPDWLFNETYIEELYKFVPQLAVNASYGEMMYAISENRWKQKMMKLRKPYNKDTEWPIGPAVVNAFYGPSGNEMVFPSGILQGVFYEKGLPRSINIGAIGTVVGHEMTHGFDDMGSQFDKDGALKEWWTNDTRAKFLEKAKCFEDEYGNITDVEANMKLNGKNTVGENIADNGGLRLAFEAYKELLQAEYNNVDTRLMDLEDFSGEQLFFIATAMIKCSRSRPEDLKVQIQYDPHSPDPYRVNVPLKNFPAFSRAFNCKKTSPMHQGKNKCVLW